MDWKDIGNLIGKAAPIIGTVVGGPAGTVIGSLIASKLGVENTPEAIYNEVKANPEALVKLKQFELDEQVMLKSHIQKMAELDFKNVDSARNREIEMTKAGHRDYIKMLLAVCAVLGFIGLTTILFVYGVPKDNNTAMLIGTGYGACLSLVKDVYNYVFGSTQGSSDKNILLHTKGA